MAFIATVRSGVERARIITLRAGPAWTLALVVGPSIILWNYFGKTLPFYPVLNVDLLVASLIACRWPRVGLAFCALGVMVAVAAGAAALFYFASPIDLLMEPELPSELDAMSLVREYAGFAALAAASTLLFHLLTTWAPPRRLPWLLGATLFCFVLDSAAVVSYLPQTSFGRLNVVGSPTMGLVRHHLLKPATLLTTVKDPHPLKERVLQWVRSNPGRGVLFVIAESLGQPTDPELAAWLNAELSAAIQGASDIDAGSVPFQGSTTAAELRQLCQLKGSYTHLSREMALNCLPTLLQELGLHSVGFHGFSGRMFQRERWWPKLGLQQEIFLETLRTQYQRQCGEAFRGICDSDLIEAAARRLSQGSAFVYILTLNTHLPVSLPQAGTPKELCTRREIPEKACALTGMHAQFLKRVGEYIRAERSVPLVVIVGDHAPPFADADNRHAFAADKVPYWVMTPLK